MNDLSKKKCIPCEGGMQALSADETKVLLSQIETWQIDEQSKEIFREYRFKDYYKTIAFVNALAWIAHQENHHPDIEVGYNRCRVRYSTHAIGGLSENDFICAAKVNMLIDNPK